MQEFFLQIFGCLDFFLGIMRGILEVPSTFVSPSLKMKTHGPP